MSTMYMMTRVKMIAHASHGTFDEPIVEFQIDIGTFLMHLL
jgi:hypothetical protein